MQMFDQDDNNGNNNTPAAAAAPAAVAVAPAEQAPALTREEELAKLRLENAELRIKQARLATLEEENASLKIKAAAKASSGGTQPVGNGMAEAQRNRCIAAAGGLARWTSIDPNTRAELQGVSHPENISSDEVKQFFGPGSSALLASRLAKESRWRYQALRIVARERGIL